MVHPKDCKCPAPSITIGGSQICPQCGVKRTAQFSKPPSSALPQSSLHIHPHSSPSAGIKQTHSSSRDHLESNIGRHFAAVTDRGKIHPTNQDYVSIIEADLGAHKAQIIVICDGVSSAQNSEIASKKGSIAAADSLVRLLKARVDVQDAMRLSIVVADRAVRKMPYDPNSQMHPPGATIVAAVFCKGWLTVGWIGDSRCYWIDSKGVQLLTHDHSWVNLVVATGAISQANAERQPDAHRIFRCIGPIFALKSNEEQPVEVNHVKLTQTGRIVVCTDGLWNYFSKPDVLAKLVNIGESAPAAILQAKALVNYALAQGGRDNVSAAVLAID